MNDTEYYVCCITFNRLVMYLLWYTGTIDDGLLRDGNGRLYVAPTRDDVPKLDSVFPSDEDPANYDFDRIRDWCDSPDPSSIDCMEFLNIWNLLDDLARDSVVPQEFAALSRGASSCYEKLFWGNNLPAVTPPGEHFVPRWRAEECQTIRDVMAAGLAMLSQEIARKSPTVAG